MGQLTGIQFREAQGNYLQARRRQVQAAFDAVVAELGLLRASKDPLGSVSAPEASFAFIRKSTSTAVPVLPLVTCGAIELLGQGLDDLQPQARIAVGLRSPMPTPLSRTTRR